MSQDYGLAGADQADEDAYAAAAQTASHADAEAESNSDIEASTAEATYDVGSASANQQTALQTAAADYALAELAARGPQETAIATADLAAANQTASNITTWQDATDANDLAASLTIDQAAHDDALADAGNEVDYDESSAELYDEVAQGIAAATTAAGYASLVADYGPLIGGPLDPSAAPYANEGASLADAALAEIQSTDTAWLTQQTTTADADLSEENTDATAQAGLINSQAAADATLTVASAQADYNGTLASIAAGPGAAAGPSLPAAPAALTTASIGFAAPSLPAQPNPAPGVPDSWFETLIGTNIESNPAAFHGPSPVTVASDEPSINVQYGQVSEAVNLAAVETSIQAPITATNDYYYFNYAVTPATYAAPTGMTYEAIAPPSGTTGSYDGNAWNPSSGDVSEAWFASATSQVLADATASHAGGWAGIPGATPAVDFGTSNAVVTALVDNGQNASIRQTSDFMSEQILAPGDLSAQTAQEHIEELNVLTDAVSDLKMKPPTPDEMANFKTDPNYGHKVERTEIVGGPWDLSGYSAAGKIGMSFLQIAFPPSEPDTAIYYEGGGRKYILGGGPSRGATRVPQIERQTISTTCAAASMPCWRAKTDSFV